MHVAAAAAAAAAAAPARHVRLRDQTLGKRVPMRSVRERQRAESEGEEEEESGFQSEVVVPG